MLKHHRHAGGARRPRLCGRIGRAAQHHLAAIGFDQPVDHFNQRRFARTIFAQERVHLAFAYRQRNIGIGHNARVGLGQPVDL